MKDKHITDCPDCGAHRKSELDICQKCGYDPYSRMVGIDRDHDHEQFWRDGADLTPVTDHDLS